MQGQYTEAGELVVAALDDDNQAEPTALISQVDLIARLLEPAESLEDTLAKIARLAVDFVPSCDTCGISLAEHGRVHTHASTGPVAQLVDEYQYLTDEGPCLSAIRDEEIIRVPKMAQEERWPSFTPMAVDAGVVSVLSIPLANPRGGVAGALNLYSSAEAFSVAEDERASGLALIAGATVEQADTASRTQRLVVNLRQALQSRELIGEAKGIVMERNRVTASEAFDLLREASQRQNVKLRDVAQWLVETGTLDGIEI